MTLPLGGAPVHQLTLLADDLGRLNRIVGGEPDSYASLLLERIGHRVEVLHAIFHPTIAELYGRARLTGDADGAALDQAFATVEAAAEDLLWRLGDDEQRSAVRVAWLREAA